MIAFLQGTIEEFTDSTAVIGVGGIGYEVSVSSETAARLSSIGIGEEVRLHTFMYIREDIIALYGFMNREELSLFRKLITVNGIGPKGGLSLLSAMSADDLRFAILSGDVKSISRAPGIGKKTAERLVLDLRDKVGADSGEEAGTFTGAGMTAAGESASAGEDSSAADAILALTALGYSRMEAVKAVRRAKSEGIESTEALLKAALKYLM